MTRLGLAPPPLNPWIPTEPGRDTHSRPEGKRLDAKRPRHGWGGGGRRGRFASDNPGLSGHRLAKARFSDCGRVNKARNDRPRGVLKPSAAPLVSFWRVLAVGFDVPTAARTVFARCPSTPGTRPPDPWFAPPVVVGGTGSDSAHETEGLSRESAPVCPRVAGPSYICQTDRRHTGVSQPDPVAGSRHTRRPCVPVARPPRPA